MIECHPILKPFVAAARPVTHAVHHVFNRIGVRHHVHHVTGTLPSTPATTMTVMTVCKKIAGPIVAGGVALLPPASVIPPAGGVGGFPGGAPGEFAGPGPAGYGPGYLPANIAGPGYGYGPFGGPIGGPVGGFGAPGLLGPANAGTPATPVLFADTPVTPVNAASPGDSTPGSTPGNSTPGSNQPDGPGGNQPGGPGSNQPGGPGSNQPGGPQPGNGTPVPEPTSAALLAAGVATLIFGRRRLRRG